LQFQRYYVKLIDLGNPVDVNALHYMLRSGLLKAPFAMEYLNRNTYDVRSRQGHVLRREPATRSFEGVYYMLHQYMRTAAPRRARAELGRRLTALTETADGGLNALDADPDEEDDSWVDSSFAEGEVLAAAEAGARLCALELVEQSSEPDMAAQLHAMAAEMRAALECYNCHGKGHMGHECEKPRTAEYAKFLEEARRAREAARPARPSGGRGAGPSRAGRSGTSASARGGRGAGRGGGAPP